MAGAVLLGLSSLSSTALAQATQEDKLPAADALLQKMVKAMGGEQAFRKHKHQTVTGDFEIPAQGITAEMVAHSAAPNLTTARFESDMEGVFLRGYDGTIAWRDDPQGGPRILEGKQLEQTVLQADFYSILNYRKNYKSIETVAKIEFAERPCYELKLTTKDGDEQKIYIDVETMFLAGSWIMLATEQGDFEVTTTYEEYKEYGGQQIATVTRAEIGSFGEQIVNISEVSFDAFDHSVFDLPDSIKALLEEESATSQPDN